MSKISTVTRSAGLALVALGTLFVPAAQAETPVTSDVVISQSVEQAASESVLVANTADTAVDEESESLKQVIIIGGVVGALVIAAAIGVAIKTGFVSKMAQGTPRRKS